MVGPSISRYTGNAALLNSFIPDEPLITMQLDGMTTFPWGDPSNYLDAGPTKKIVPAHWLNIRYSNIPYYGGLFLDLAAVAWVPLKLLGLPLFPTAPIILRAISLFFSVLTLVALYNFGRRHFGVVAAISGPVFLLTEFYFVGLSSVIHPDTLLFLLCIVGLALSIRHAKDGEPNSLLALGIVAGLAQGAKMGGPLLVPITAASIFLGTSIQGASLSTTRKILVRGAAVAGVAIFVFVLTTPYSLLGTYYLETWRIWAKAFVGESPIVPVNFWSWLSQSTFHIGYEVIATACAALMVNIATSSTREARITLALTVGLGLSIFLWYALFQNFWVQLQYLLISFALVAMLAGSLLDKILSVRPRWMMTKTATASIAICLLIGGFALTKTRAANALAISLNNFFWKSSPTFQVGDWLSQNQPSVTNGRVLFDLQAYFDPSKFPNQYPNGGPVRWVDLVRVRPDYFALTVYGSLHWMGEKMKNQDMTRSDPDYWNMRLYQDLLGKDADNISSENPFPFITQVAKFVPQKCDDINAPFFSRTGLVCLAASVTGPTIILFKLNADQLNSDFQGATNVEKH